MADISREIQAFQDAVYGREVRQSMIDLCVKVNNEVETSTTTSQNAVATANTASEVANEASQTASAERDSAHAYAVESESWAIGGTGTREGENTNNAKYYADLAKSFVPEGYQKLVDDVAELDTTVGGLTTSVSELNTSVETLTTEQEQTASDVELINETIGTDEELDNLPYPAQSIAGNITQINTNKAKKNTMFNIKSADVLVQTGSTVNVDLSAWAMVVIVVYNGNAASSNRCYVPFFPSVTGASYIPLGFNGSTGWIRLEYSNKVLSNLTSSNNCSIGAIYGIVRND